MEAVFTKAGVNKSKSVPDQIQMFLPTKVNDIAQKTL